MANLCSNQLEVRGLNRELLMFLKGLKGKPACYLDEEQVSTPIYTQNTYVPVPEEVLQSKTSQAGVDWKIAHWGTKWDAFQCEEYLEEELDEIVARLESSAPEENGGFIVSFNTPWTPIVPWVETIASQFPQLCFDLYYEESGCNFAGHLKIEDGDMGHWTYEDVVEYWLNEGVRSLGEVFQEFEDLYLQPEDLVSRPTEPEFEWEWKTHLLELLESEVQEFFGSALASGCLTRDILENEFLAN